MQPAMLAILGSIATLPLDIDTSCHFKASSSPIAVWHVLRLVSLSISLRCSFQIFPFFDTAGYANAI